MVDSNTQTTTTDDAETETETETVTPQAPVQTANMTDDEMRAYLAEKDRLRENTRRAETRAIFDPVKGFFVDNAPLTLDEVIKAVEENMSSMSLISRGGQVTGSGDVFPHLNAFVTGARGSRQSIRSVYEQNADQPPAPVQTPTPLPTS